MVGAFHLDIVVANKDVTRLMTRLDTALNPVSLGAFLQGNMVPHLHQQFEAGFVSESDPAGVGWAPLSDATVNIRTPRYGGAHPINVRTHELERYITQSPGTLLPATDQAILRYPADKVPTGKLGKKLRGAQQGEGTAPPRPVVGLTPADQAYLHLSLTKYIETAARL